MSLLERLPSRVVSDMKLITIMMYVLNFTAYPGQPRDLYVALCSTEDYLKIIWQPGDAQDWLWINV